MSDIFYDGDFTEASPVSVKRKTYPFEGDTDSFYFEQDFVQTFEDFERLPLDVADDEIENAYLVDETPLQELGIGIGRWTRTYSTIPNSRIEQESFAYEVPGILPDPIVFVHVISSGVQPFASPYTRITIGTPNFDIAVGDLVIINYTVVTTSPSTVFQRSITRQVRAINSGAGTFDVDLISDIEDPIYNVTYRFNNARGGMTRTVPSFVHYDYYLPGVSAGITTPADIPIIQAASIVDQNGDKTDKYSTLTTPTLAAYRLAVAAGTLIVAEASVVKRWKGNIYERVTRYVKSI